MPTIELPTLHPGQIRIWNQRTKRNLIRCGRRWGKTKMMVTLAADTSTKGGKTGLFAPEHRQLREPYSELLSVLHPVKSQSSKTDGTIRTITGGVIDFWSLNDNELAGRGREYDRIMIDEAAFSKNSQMFDIWERSIKPTMATRPNADVWVFSTPNGKDPENFFYKLHIDPEQGFQDFHAPSSDSPYVTPEFLADEKRKTNPLVYQQEYDAEFVSWDGVAFFTQENILVDGQPVEYPRACDAVFAVIDTAVKDGKQHDGTAVVFCAVDNGYAVHRLVVLDWDIIQIQGAMLETWLPTVFQRLEGFAKQCGARMGSMGAFIEDKASGSVLLQHVANRGWPAEALPSKLTAMGKDERAISVSGYWHQGLMKISRHAYEKQTDYKGMTRNQFIAQVCGFRLGAKPGAADDLADCAMYSLAIACGNQEGF
jgi:hypothetical protein